MVDDKPQPRIDNVTAGLMVALAVAFDLLSLIPFVNIVVDVAALVSYGIWFAIKGVGFINPRRFATMVVTVVVEAIPALSVLPGFTVAIIATILMIKSEDRLGVNVTTLASGKPPIK